MRFGRSPLIRYPLEKIASKLGKTYQYIYIYLSLFGLCIKWNIKFTNNPECDSYSSNTPHLAPEKPPECVQLGHIEAEGMNHTPVQSFFRAYKLTIVNYLATGLVNWQLCGYPRPVQPRRLDPTATSSFSSSFCLNQAPRNSSLRP